MTKRAIHIVKTGIDATTGEDQFEALSSSVDGVTGQTVAAETTIEKTDANGTKYQMKKQTVGFADNPTLPGSHFTTTINNSIPTNMAVGSIAVVMEEV